MIQKKGMFVPLVAVLWLIAGTVSLQAHCQVPCGIYDDPMRVQMIAEHITTIEKAMKQIKALSSDKVPNYNQIVRWVVNKEKHAEELSDIVTYYFMAQRLKPADQGEARKKYLHQLELLHRMLVHAMKAKQTVDLKEVEELRGLLKKFKQSYFTHHHEH